jgi:ureidoglycolate lyase
MKQVKIQAISREAFAPFGEFYNMASPDGYALAGAIHKFYPDRLTTACTGRLAFSPLVVKKPERMIITQQEYHTTTEELILPLNDDMIIHVAPASGGAVVTEYAKAFLVPKNTLVKLKAAIWHLAPLPATKDELTALIILPECTYANDCPVVDLSPDEQFEIVE